MSDLERALGRGVGDADRRAAEDAARRVAARAAAAGLADLRYATVPTPVGDLLAVVSGRGLIELSYEDGRGDALLENLARRVSPRLVEAPAELDDVRRQLGEYFEGRRRAFELALDWRLTHGFGRRVLQVTAAIPYGEHGTYTTVATGAGSPRAMRATGNALGANPMPIVVPCHRVLRSGGGLGGYTGGIERKRFLLELENALPA